MRRSGKLAIVSLTILIFLASSISLLAQAKQPLITQGIDEHNLVTLSGNTRPEANAANDRGPVTDDLLLEDMYLLLKQSPEQQQAADDLINRLHDPNAPEYHQWLTADQIAAQFGPADQDIQTITTWLASHGFSVNTVYGADGVIDFSGPASAIREAFHTEIHNLSVNGRPHIANMSDPQIPAALAPAIQGVVSLNDFRPRKMIAPKAQYTIPPGAISPNSFYAVVPADLAKIYDFNPLFSAGITGQGQTIAVIEDSDVYNPDDWNTFRKTFGLDAYKGASFETVHPGRCTDPGVDGPYANDDDIEAILDAEWASAAAPSADIWVTSCADTTTTFGGLIAIQNLLNQPHVPPIISMSYGLCEVLNGAAGNEAFRDAYQQAVLEGVSVFVSAGDEGAASCDAGLSIAQSGVTVSGLASTAYNVAVGGTDFGDLYGTFVGGKPLTDYWSSTNSATFGSALSYVPEIPWNDSCASTLITSVEGYSTPYGANGFCASAIAIPGFITTAAGSGGPSNCATGVSDVGIIPPTLTVTFPTPADGTCSGWKKPAWQSVLGNPNDGVRDLPDVSMFASNGVWGHFYVVCDSDPVTGSPCVGAPYNWYLGGGTSFAAPIMAGIQALINETAGGSQGNPNYVYYSLAAQEYHFFPGTAPCNSTLGTLVSPNCIFHDVTLGDNDVDCAPGYNGDTLVGIFNCYLPSGTVGVLSLSNHHYEPAYPATPGWDFATGLGSVNVNNLVRSWPGSQLH